MAAAGVMQGAMQGASAGSAFGPWGAAAGAVIGGIAGNQDGGSDASEAAHAMFDRQYQAQKEFAMNGIRWRVDDARAAGIHPGLALGAQLAGPSFAIGGYGKEKADTSWLSEAGQDITRAVHGTRTQSERSEAFQTLQLENMRLQNQFVAAQIAKLTSSQTGPAMVDPSAPGVRIFGSGDVSIKEEPMERSTSFIGRPYQEAGAVNELGFARTPTGFAPVMSKDFKERAEDDFLSEVPWHIRNRIPQMINREWGYPPPETWLSPGAEWRWNAFKQEWQERFTPRAQSRVRYPIN